MARMTGAEAVYRAAAAFRDRGLRTSDSVFTPGARIWSEAVLADLDERLRGSRSVSPGRSFAQRWDAALGGAEPATVQLAAEACYVHVLFAADLAPATKRALVMGTLGRLERPPSLMPGLDAALEVGVAGTGVAFKARRLSQLGLLVSAGRAWLRLPRDEREDRLGDGFAFKAWLFACEHDGAHAQREALLHLLFPETFEAVVSPAVKRRIVEAFAPHVPGGVDDVDRALLAVRAALTAHHPPGFAFADPSVAPLWQSPPAQRPTA